MGSQQGGDPGGGGGSLTGKSSEVGGLVRNPFSQALYFFSLFFLYESKAMISSCILVYNVLSNSDQDVFIYIGEKYNYDKKAP